MWAKMARLEPFALFESKAIDKAIGRVVDSGNYIGGREVVSFEKKWADYCGAKYCVGVSSGFAALQLIVRALEIPNVYYPTLTCMPTVLALEEAGVHTVPVVPNDGCFVLSPEHIRDDGVNVVVNLYGLIDHHIFEGNEVIVEDAAQAHGSLYRVLGRASYTTAAAWSFYPTKNLGAMGDAGAVTTNNEGLARVVGMLRSYKGRGGINARMDPLQAAILDAKLPFLEARNSRRAANAETYLVRLKGSPLVLPDEQPEHLVTNWHQFVVQYTNRDKLRAWLYTHGVETQVHYDRPAITGRGPNYKPSDWEERWSTSVLSLPVGPHLSERDIHGVCDLIEDYFGGIGGQE